jgi:Fe-S-cluster containining protein
MFRKDLLKPTDLITIRKGEPVYSNFTGEVAPAPVEMIKIKENPDSKTCSFFRRMDDSCAIYENRPEQCRDQECWNPAHVPAAGGERLQRAALLKDTAQLWDVIQHHENRCAQDEFSRAMARLSATHGQTVEEVLELLRYDHYIREFVMEQFGLNPDSMSFFFGRPLKETLFMYGLRLEEQPDGCFLLKPVEEGVHTGSATGD